jgi:hypothetical protein
MSRSISTRPVRAACGAVALGLGMAFTLLASDRADADWWTVRADIPGRWLLHTESHIYCVVSFSGASDIPHGTVAAMGFCPRPLLSRPRWRFDADRVVISNRHGDVVADLAILGRTRLQGQIATGEEMSLTR